MAIKASCTITLTRVNDGKKGDTGLTGKSVHSITKEFSLSTSKTTAPSSGWTTNYSSIKWEPGKYLWTRDSIIYKNPDGSLTSAIPTNAVCSTEWEAVNDIEIGGRNLLVGDTGTKVENSNYILASYKISENVNIIPNNIYTISFDGELLDAGLDGFYINVFPKPWASIKSHVVKNESGHYVVTFNMPENDGNITHVGIYSHPVGAYKKSSVKNVKLETGNKPTDWTPAPEDIEDKINKTPKSIDVMYAQNASSTTAPSNGWSSTTNDFTWQDGCYIWTKTITTLNDGSTSSTKPVCITGAKGSAGLNGANGKNVVTADTDIRNFSFADYTTCSTIGRSDVWARINNVLSFKVGDIGIIRGKLTDKNKENWMIYGEVTAINSSAKSITLKTTSSTIDGSTGPQGGTGPVGQGVSSITELYKILTTKAQQPTPTSDSGWTTTPPTWSSGKYIHTCSKIVYKNPTSVSYTKPVCDSSWEAVNELEIGGRNLILNSDFGASKKYVVPEGSSGELGYWADLAYPIIGGINEEYTFEAFIRGNTQIRLYLIQTGGNEAYTLLSRNNISSDDYKKVVFTFKIKAGKTLNRLFICTSYGESKPGEWLEIADKSVKFEKGNKPTDWTPAPEDVEQNINNKFDNLSNQVTESIKSIKSSLDVNTSNIKAQVESITQLNKQINGDMETVGLVSKVNNIFVSDTFTQFTNSISNLEKVVDGQKSTLTANSDAINDISNWVRIDANGMHLGKSNAAVTCHVDNDEIAFYSGENNKIAYFSDNILKVNRAIIVTSIGCGGFTFTHEKNGDDDKGFSLL